MVELKKIEVDGEVVTLSKTQAPIFSRWHIVYPIKNDDGSINWKHLISGGSWWNLIFVILFVLIIIGAGYEYKSNLQACADAMGNINWYEQTYNPFKYDESIRRSIGYGNPNFSIGLEVNDSG